MHLRELWRKIEICLCLYSSKTLEAFVPLLFIGHRISLHVKPSLDFVHFFKTESLEKLEKPQKDWHPSRNTLSLLYAHVLWIRCQVRLHMSSRYVSGAADALLNSLVDYEKLGLPKQTPKAADHAFQMVEPLTMFWSAQYDMHKLRDPYLLSGISHQV